MLQAPTEGIHLILKFTLDPTAIGLPERSPIFRSTGLLGKAEMPNPLIVGIKVHGRGRMRHAIPPFIPQITQR